MPLLVKQLYVTKVQPERCSYAESPPSQPGRKPVYMKRVTSIEVARRAGVSQSTVSRVFNDKAAYIAEATRQKVLRASEELGYTPNAIARMMSTRQTHIIGIVMANITSPFYPYVLEKFLQRLQEIGRNILMFTAAPNQDIDDMLPLILQHRIDALIITSATLSSEMAEVCTQQGTPVILFNRYVAGATASAVCADNVEGGRRIADTLLDTGHERLAFVAGNTNTSTNNDRERGFTDRLTERGYTSMQRAQADFNYESGFAAARALLQGRQPPDALFCANDIMAIGALEAARSLRLRVPQDVSIIGYDNIPMTGWASYNLTTFSQEAETMIDEALRVLAEKLACPTSAPVFKLVPGRLVVRGSVRGLQPGMA